MCTSLLSGCQAQVAPSTLQDGTYLVEVALEGGTGKAHVTTPATMTVQAGRAVATITWSSPHYDYMVVDGERILPTNKTGNAMFQIPVSDFDKPLEVVADTTAMSTPHEITYELTFSSQSIQPAK